MEKLLTDVCKIQYGYPFDSSKFSSESGVPVIRIRDVVRGYSETYTTEEYNEEYIVNDGDMIVGMDGEFNIGKWNGGIALLNQRVCRLVPTSEIDANYLFYFMPLILKRIEDATPFATVKHLSAKQLNKILVPLPSKEEQTVIANTFVLLDNLIGDTKKQLEKLDLLVKSRFIELFGDYDLSHAQSDWKSISEIGKVVGGATPKTNIEEYWDGEYRWVTPAELSSDSGYIYDSVRKLTKAGVDSCSLQEMPIDTVILSSRAPIGKVAIAGNTFYCNQGFKNIICNKEILPRYLYTVLLLNTEYLNSLGRGATFKEISKSIVENIRVPVPPIELQEQFTAFVEQTDKSKLAVQQSLEKLETLKKSLMQQYFG